MTGGHRLLQLAGLPGCGAGALPRRPRFFLSLFFSWAVLVYRLDPHTAPKNGMLHQMVGASLRVQVAPLEWFEREAQRKPNHLLVSLFSYTPGRQPGVISRFYMDFTWLLR